MLFFGGIRTRNWCNNNPEVCQFKSALSALLINNTQFHAWWNEYPTVCAIWQEHRNKYCLCKLVMYNWRKWWSCKRNTSGDGRIFAPEMENSTGILLNKRPIWRCPNANFMGFPLSLRGWCYYRSCCRRQFSRAANLTVGQQIPGDKMIYYLIKSNTS